MIAETDNDAHWQSYIYEPDSFRPLALIKGNAQQDKIQRYWYQNDQLGTPIRLTDSIGETLYQCEYNAYGQVIDENYYCDNIDTLPDNPLPFQGQYYDEETGLHYNLNRYYDPLVGLYITQDPIKLIGSINFYQYCPNPVNWIDPLGFKGMPGAATTRTMVPDGVPINQALFDKIRALPKGDRPLPETYLPQEYIEAHLAQFEEGAGFFITRENLERYGMDIVGRPDGQFVMPISEINQIISKNKGNICQIEKAMGIPSGSWSSSKELILIKIDTPNKFNLRMPIGSEEGANEFWMPGGKLPQGGNEAIIDPITKGNYNIESVTEIK